MPEVQPHSFPRTRLCVLSLVVCSAVTLFSCSKEGFDIESTTIHTPPPDTLFVVDCPNLWLNVGDTCESHIFNLPGVVSNDCTCDVDFSNASEEFISITIENETLDSKEVAVTSSHPLMQGECCIQLTAGSSTTRIYSFPTGTSDVIVGIAFDCDNGPEAAQAHLFNSEGIHGSSADFVIACPN